MTADNPPVHNIQPITSPTDCTLTTTSTSHSSHAFSIHQVLRSVFSLCIISAVDVHKNKTTCISEITKKSSFTLLLICPTPEHEEHHRMRRGSFQTQHLPMKVRQTTAYNSSRRPSHGTYQLTSLVHCWNHNSFNTIAGPTLSIPFHIALSGHLTELQLSMVFIVSEPLLRSMLPKAVLRRRQNAR